MPQVAFFWWVTRLLISSSSLVTSTPWSLVMQSSDGQYRTRDTCQGSTCHVPGWLTYLTGRQPETLWHVKFVNSELGNQKIKSISGLELHIWLLYYFPSPFILWWWKYSKRNVVWKTLITNLFYRCCGGCFYSHEVTYMSHTFILFKFILKKIVNGWKLVLCPTTCKVQCCGSH